MNDLDWHALTHEKRIDIIFKLMGVMYTSYGYNTWDELPKKLVKKLSQLKAS